MHWKIMPLKSQRFCKAKDNFRRSRKKQNNRHLVKGETNIKDRYPFFSFVWIFAWENCTRAFREEEKKRSRKYNKTKNVILFLPGMSNFLFSGISFFVSFRSCISLGGLKELYRIPLIRLTEVHWKKMHRNPECIQATVYCIRFRMRHTDTCKLYRHREF